MRRTGLIGRLLDFVTPLQWRQENFHHGRQLLWVMRWGRRTWEVWEWGPNIGSNDVDRLLRGASKAEGYGTIRSRATLLLSTTTWREAKDLV